MVRTSIPKTSASPSLPPVSDEESAAILAELLADMEVEGEAYQEYLVREMLKHVGGTFDPVKYAALASLEIVGEKSNPHHKPKGPGGGQFAKGKGPAVSTTPVGIHPKAIKSKVGGSEMTQKSLDAQG